VALALVLGCAGQAVAQLPPVVQALGPADRLKSERQREQVGTLARRHLGRPLRSEGTSDLAVLQRLLDERIVAPDDVFGLQALGVVLGDVMARTLPLHWVAIDDDRGHSRALRYRETDALFFPVTMISKRIQNHETVRVRALYDLVAGEVARLEARRRPSRLPRVAPPRPGPD
jgi:hypothetical protein